MSIDSCLIIVRGGGDLGTGVVYRLVRSGFPVIVLELAHPLVVRRRVALASAVLEGEIMIEDLHGQLVQTAAEAEKIAYEGIVPVLVAAELEPVMAELSRPVYAVIDARLAKRLSWPATASLRRCASRSLETRHRCHPKCDLSIRI